MCVAVETARALVRASCARACTMSAAGAGHLHVRTPCIDSVALSQKTGCRVHLKLENTQPSGSFKIRGIGKGGYRKVYSGISFKVTNKQVTRGEQMRLFAF